MIIASLDVRRLVDVIRQFPSSSGTTMDSFLEEQARLLVSSSGNVPGLVQVTPPHSAGVRGTKAKKQGEAAVEHDISRVYATPADVYKLLLHSGGEKMAKQWWLLLKKDPRKAALFLKSKAPSAISSKAIGFDSGAAHEAARGSDGRVRGRYRVIVINELGALKRYVNKKRKKVGLLASSVPVAVGGKFGKLNGIPSWVKRHQSSWGYVQDKKKRNGRTITLGVNKKGVRDMQRRFTYVVSYRMKALQRQLPHLIRKLERRLQTQLAQT